MADRILISSEDPDLWDKLDAIQKIDPAVSGGIEGVVYGRQAISRNQPISGFLGSGYEEIHEVEPGFCVHFTDAMVAQDWRLTAKSLKHVLRLRLAFSGEAGYMARETRVRDEGAQCSFIILPPGEPLTATFRGGVAYRFCSLSLSKDYLSKTLALEDSDFPPVLTSHWSRLETGMGHFTAAKASLNQASRFFNIRLGRAWHDLTVRTLALDLLRMLFQDWRSARDHVLTSIRLAPPERARLQRIREQIDANPAARITLAALSSRHRLNRNKLHFGFKQSFGISIHEYQTERRMQAALQLLETTDIPVSDVGAQVGYEEPTNFTASFKKHFAALPTEIRRRKGGNKNSAETAVRRRT
jgi:AraC family transcriptional regulator, transcriptional activator of the genes for pyochelin and ferripyochelin receptors